jgi:hypothetical protein
MNIHEIFAWYNVLFGLSILIGVVFILASIWGMDIGGDMDVDADIDADADVDADAKVSGPDDSFVGKALALLGLGKCPLSIMMFTASLIFGGTGLLLNVFFAPGAAWISVLGAFGAMMIFTRFVSNTVALIIPRTESYGVVPEHFIGMTGKVYLTVSEKFGQIHIHDHHGSLHTLDVRAYPGAIYPVSTQVFVVEYNPETNTFFVEETPQEIE